MPAFAIKTPVNEVRPIEAPPNIAKLFLAYMDAGRPYALYHALEERLWPYRGRWLIADQWVFYLSNRDDVIKIRPRSMAFPMRGKP